MAYKFFNPNPDRIRVGDCVVRAIAKATDQDWESTYLALMMEGLTLHDMPSSNHVWGMYLYRKGFDKKAIDMPCIKCYTLADFCRDHPKGSYVVGTGSHAIAVCDGDIYDTWDSSSEIPIFYWRK